MTDNPFRLDGRVAVITGASRNIGAACSRAFAAVGADLVLVARGEERLERVAAEIREASGRRVVTVVADVGSAEGLERIIAGADAAFDRVDVLVNNAAHILPEIAMLEQTFEDWDASVRANVWGPYRLTQVFGGRMAVGEGGSIINMISTAAHDVVPGRDIYAMTKSALWTQTRYFANALAPKVRVNAICPGTVSRDGTFRGVAQWERLLQKIPLGRIGTAPELAWTAIYLASDASSYTTGTEVFVDGGRVGGGSSAG